MTIHLFVWLCIGCIFVLDCGLRVLSTRAVLEYELGRYTLRSPTGQRLCDHTLIGFMGGLISMMLGLYLLSVACRPIAFDQSDWFCFIFGWWLIPSLIATIFVRFHQRPNGDHYPFFIWLIA